MLGSYKYTRDEIVKKILKSPVTQDGYYVCKNFRKWVRARGTKTDKGYTFNRDPFFNKICFSNAEIEVFIEKDISHFNLETMKKKDIFLMDIISDELKHRLSDKIDKSEFTLGELIDSAIYYINYKF